MVVMQQQGGGAGKRIGRRTGMLAPTLDAAGTTAQRALIKGNRGAAFAPRGRRAVAQLGSRRPPLWCGAAVESALSSALNSC
jgi:hypothetical protein